MSSFRSARCSKRRRSRHWRSGCTRRRRRGRRWCAWRGPLKFRCRLRSGGCGSCIAWKDRAPPTTSPWRCGSPARSIKTALEAALGDVWRATRACARSSPKRRECRGSTSSRIARRRASADEQCHRGRPPGRRDRCGAARLRSGQRAAAARASVRAWRARACVALAARTTLRATAGRWRRCGAMLRWRMGRALKAKRRRLRRCRCSTPTTRCGSTRCWVSESDPHSAMARQLSFWSETLQDLPDAD